MTNITFCIFGTTNWIQKIKKLFISLGGGNKTQHNKGKSTRLIFTFFDQIVAFAIVMPQFFTAL